MTQDFATRIIAPMDDALAGRLDDWRAQQTDAVADEPVDPAP